MEDGTNKTIGYVFIIFGVLMVLYPVFSVYQVFNGQARPFNLFSFQPIAMDLSQLVAGAPKNSLTQELVSSDLLNKPMNLIAHLILMGFISTAGLRVATIGTQLARTIKVNVKEEKSILFPSKAK